MPQRKIVVLLEAIIWRLSQILNACSPRVNVMFHTESQLRSPCQSLGIGRSDDLLAVLSSLRRNNIEIVITTADLVRSRVILDRKIVWFVQLVKKRCLNVVRAHILQKPIL